MERSQIIILAFACTIVYAPSVNGDSTRPGDWIRCVVYEADVPASEATPVDPIIEEPLRPIERVSSETLLDEGVARCGPLGPIPLGMSLLLAATAIQFISRSGPSVACEDG